MKFVTYEYNGKEKVGVLAENTIIPLDGFGSMYDLIENFREDLVNVNSSEKLPIEAVKLLAPIPKPRRNLLCLGKNYEDHAKELGATKISDKFVPDDPIYFTKAAEAVIGNGDFIKYSPDVTNQVDYEVELAIVIGKEGKNIKQEEAEDYIFGYTIVNDVSARDLQIKHKQWFKAKSLDTFAPMGPCIVHKNEISLPLELDIKSIVNGEVRQNSNTRLLIFNIPYIISDLSKGFTLKPGDIICTGTPSGVGFGFNPPRLLKAGDTVECCVEKIGTLINKVKAI
ncbi:fumarylacetoacetate hydrolase family protein [Clostridium swellfunianum]|uniref:fumarylacetoacetate hydrolase family protein n=1 Tax=Clostridium swellfunianum TaxID=1367462 RepID=UPI00202F02D1|nr:fumarylacetoacetate hydrolase family protein [Clostridium swellfunianum]MCM0649330.1 fumarylacetoacetate hydrolase family protein [Clostridium swellfunianum]